MTDSLPAGFTPEQIKNLAISIKRDPIDNNVFNPAQLRFFSALASNDVVIIIASMGNGTGKTFGLMSMVSAIMFGTQHTFFNRIPLVSSWPYPKSLRICSTSKMVEDTGPIQTAIKLLFPYGRWEQSKGMGKGFYCQGKGHTGWTWDVVTYNQAATEMAGDTKGLIVYSEPPPEDLFNENLARLRAGGLVIVEMTPLNYCGWMLEKYIEPGVLKNEKDEVIGKVVTVQGDIHENCAEHAEGGQLPHIAIERTLASYDEDEREARRTGAFMALGGRVLKRYSTKWHEWDLLPEYFKKCMDTGAFNLICVVDPHDRKPFAFGWYAIFPNDDIICIAEFPDDSFLPFHKLKSFDYITEDYAKMIKATEAAIGRVADYRLIDPNFGNTACFSSNKTVKQEFTELGEKPEINYPLMFEDAVDLIPDGHIAMKSAIGDPENNIKPKYFNMSHCKNHCYGLSHYAWKEHKDSEKGLSEKPELKNKDYPDLVRYLLMAGITYTRPDLRERPALWTPNRYFKDQK